MNGTRRAPVVSDATRPERAIAVHMTHSGTVRTTYGAAIRLGEATPGPEDLVVAVAPRPESASPSRSGGASPSASDRVRGADADQTRALAPPTQLQFDLDRALDRLDPTDAWDAVAYESRYRTFLETDAEARRELARIRRHLAAGGTVWFVCPTNAPAERRNRDLLLDVLGEPLRSDGGRTEGFG